MRRRVFEVLLPALVLAVLVLASSAESEPPPSVASTPVPTQRPAPSEATAEPRLTEPPALGTPGRVDAPSPEVTARPTSGIPPSAISVGRVTYAKTVREGTAAAPWGYWHMEPVRVLVSVKGKEPVEVFVTGYCQCHVGTDDERALDLNPADFAKLAPLWRGKVLMRIERFD